MKYLYALFILLLALFLAAFIQQNGAPTVVRYFAWSTPPLPLSLYIILAFGVGYALAVVVGFSSGIRSRVRLSDSAREIKRLSREVARLRELAGAEGESAPGTAVTRAIAGEPEEEGTAAVAWEGEEERES